MMNQIIDMENLFLRKYKLIYMNYDKKIAIILFGISYMPIYKHPSRNYISRDWRTCYLSLFKYICNDLQKNYKIDFYLSTYNNPKLDLIINTYKPEKIYTTDYIVNRTLARNSLFLEGLNLIKNSNKTYDAIIITRFDLYFKEELNKYISYDKFSYLKPYNSSEINDNFFYIPMNLFDKFYSCCKNWNITGSKNFGHINSMTMHNIPIKDYFDDSEMFCIESNKSESHINNSFFIIDYIDLNINKIHFVIYGNQNKCDQIKNDLTFTGKKSYFSHCKSKYDSIKIYDYSYFMLLIKNNKLIEDLILKEFELINNNDILVIANVDCVTDSFIEDIGFIIDNKGYIYTENNLIVIKKYNNCIKDIINDKNLFNTLN